MPRLITKMAEQASEMAMRDISIRLQTTVACHLSVKDPQFVLSNQMLDAKIKQLKKDGMQNTTHKPAIELEDLQKLKKSEILSLTHPLTLLRNVWFHISLFWFRRVFNEDAKGNHFVSMRMTKPQKTTKARDLQNFLLFSQHPKWVITPGKPIEKFVNDTPSARDLLTFLVFSQHPAWVIMPVNR